MKFTRNVKAVSKLLLILLLLMATIVGAILSYLWVIGYYVSLERVYPEDVTVNITDYAFDYQNTSFFNVTIQNPTSYTSKEPANITQIIVSTEDGVLHDKIDTDPPLPHKFQRKGEVETFKCLWNWANYTGETVKIIAFVADGSGPTFETETPLVDLKITEVQFNVTISVTHFNVTVENSPSVTYVNITEVTIDKEPIPAENLSIPLPYTLDPDESVSFKSTWDWSDYQDKNITVAVYTAQGYVAYRTRLTPKPVNLTITDVLFNPLDMDHFVVTVQNPTGSNFTITTMNVTVEGEFPLNRTDYVVPSLPRMLTPDTNLIFICEWNWAGDQGKNVTITIETSEGYTTSRTLKIPSV